MIRACRECLTRSWLLARLGGHLDLVRSRLGPLLGLPDGALLGAVGGDARPAIEDELARLDTGRLMAAARAVGVAMICGCDAAYPARLHDLEAPPAVLHVRGDPERLLALSQAKAVAIVGSRRATAYGLEVAHALGRSLAASGVTVVSGLARGIDTAAHQGALERGPTVAVLPGPAERPYPTGQHGLYRRVIATGAAVSELPCGTGVRRWSFLARNRIIAALADATVVVEATEGSGALPTADTAATLARPVGAVPGRVTTAQAAGPNSLLAGGAAVIRDAQDVLDLLYGVGIQTARHDERRDPLTIEQQDLLRGLDGGLNPSAAMRGAGISPERGLAMLSELEIGGWVRRGAGGSFTVIP